MEQASSARAAATVSAGQFTDVDHGWLVLGNTTWHTADGGRTWTRG